jgi:hypothetical protein
MTGRVLHAAVLSNVHDAVVVVPSGGRQKLRNVIRNKRTPTQKGRLFQRRAHPVARTISDTDSSSACLSRIFSWPAVSFSLGLSTLEDTSWIPLIGF